MPPRAKHPDRKNSERHKQSQGGQLPGMRPSPVLGNVDFSREMIRIMLVGFGRFLGWKKAGYTKIAGRTGMLRQDGTFGEETRATGTAAGDPETALLEKERAKRLRNALTKLPPNYREVLVLRELEELSYKEISGIIGVPLGTVMSRLSRARIQLQQNLSGRSAPA
jgi:RNA polymerase sigma factor (sigma-70 family)